MSLNALLVVTTASLCWVDFVVGMIKMAVHGTLWVHDGDFQLISRK
jgi:hypothetical protein